MFEKKDNKDESKKDSKEPKKMDKSKKSAKGSRDKAMLKKESCTSHDTEHEDSRKHSYLSYDAYKRQD